MRMSAKAEYAVRAMVELATLDDGVRVTTDDLAQRAGNPAAVSRRHLVRRCAPIGWCAATAVATAVTN